MVTTWEEISGLRKAFFKNGKRFFSITLVFFILFTVISIRYYSVPTYAAVNPALILVWELIISTLTSGGVAPVNASVNAAGMASGLGTHTVAEVLDGTYNAAAINADIQALTNSSKYYSQVAGELANTLSSTAADASAAQSALNAASSVPSGIQAASGAMTAGENIAQSAEILNQTGAVVATSGLALTGAAGLTAAAVAPIAGVGLGILTNNLITKYGSAIKNGVTYTMTGKQPYLQAMYPNGTSIQLYDDGTYTKYLCMPENTFVVASNPSNEQYYLDIYSYDGNSFTYKIYMNRGNSTLTYSGSGGHGGLSTRQKILGGNVYYLPNNVNLSDYVSSIKNGTTPRQYNYSPDLITPDGNAEYNINNNTYNINPSYNTTNQTFSPITNNDYQTFMNTVNNNTDNNNYQNNEQVFNNFISNYIENIDTSTNTDPDIPEQPVKPTVTPNTPEQIEQNKEMMLPVNLKDYFPFCIPFDIYTLMTHFSDIEREAPNIDIDLDLGSAGEYTINFDLSDYDDVASILRSLELIAFIIGLMVAARKLIGD